MSANPEEKSGVKRRALLTAAAGSLFALSGCLSGLGSRSERRGVMLTRLSVANNTNTSHTVSVEVLYDGDVVLSKEYEAGPKQGNQTGGKVIDIQPPAEPSEVVIRANMGDQSEEINLQEKYGEACSKVIVWIESGGNLDFLTSNDGTECFQGTPLDTET